MEKRTTIYDVAERLGISVATVNRALTGKPQVKAKTRELVIKTAAEMNFKPNQLAQTLSRSGLRFAVLGFTGFPEFHGEFLRGARDAGAELKDYKVRVDFFSYDVGATNTPESDEFLESTIHKIVDAKYDGALVLARQADSFAEFGKNNIYLATAVNDIQRDLRQFSISYDGYTAGRMAAQIIYHWLPDKQLPVAISSGWEDIGIHARIVSGFREQMKDTPLNLHSIYYNYDNEDIAYESTIHILKEEPRLGAIYINSFNYRGVIRAVQEMGLAGKIILISSDISRELRELIQSGVVAASIFQNQYEQGKQGLHNMYQAVARSASVDEYISIKPQIIMGSNLSLY